MTEQQPGRILVVDDDDAIRMMVERVLRREKYEVECARDGFEAIEKLSKNDYGAVLLDLMMPRVDGHGVLRFLEKEARQRKPRVIIMTANLAGAAETRAEAVVKVLPKPFDIRELLRQVRACAPIPEQQPRPAQAPVSERAMATAADTPSSASASPETAGGHDLAC